LAAAAIASLVRVMAPTSDAARRRPTLRLWAIALFLGLWSFAAGWVSAQPVQPVPALTGRVVDATGTLQSQGLAALEARLQALETERGSQVVVLVVATTQPEDIAAYAQRIGDAWKIGRRDVGDGVLIVVARDDRRVNIQVAKALEGAVPDLAARQIIDNQIRPAFRAGDYAGGLLAAVDQLGLRIAGEGLPAPAPGDGGWHGEAMPGFQSWQDVAIFLFAAVPIGSIVLTRVFGRRLGSLLSAGAIGGLAWWITASVALAVAAGVVTWILVGLLGFGSATRGGLSGRSGGRGGPVVWGGGHHGGGWSSGGGGFRSGGGGDFGGGGASGSW
jgi:uncharacterized protein